VGDLAADTAPDGADGRFTTKLVRDWEIWGPNGGYVASVALRAAGAHTSLPRPVSIAVHFVGVADFAPVDLTVGTIKRTKRSESMRVSMTQGGSPVLEALVWAADERDGLTHASPSPHSPPDPRRLQTFQERRLAQGEAPPPHPFWDNFDYRPDRWIDDWDAREVLEPVSHGWYRFVPTETFDDPWVDACRGLILVDTLVWPAACGAYREGEMTHFAPSIDLACTFHAREPQQPWLFAWAEAPVAREGLVAGRTEVWTESGTLAASGVSTLLCLPVGRRPDAR
jgi:acyl-CoA thioesterase